MIRKGKLKLKLFVEGDTEENYFKKFRKNNNVEIIYKEINLGGGGYTSFLKEIKKSSDRGYVATFIIIDLDRFINEPSQNKPFEELVKYCRRQNKNGRIPYFLIATNRDFEFFACSHCKDYKDSHTTAYIINKFDYPSLDEFKSDKKLYEFLNSNSRSFENAINKIKGRKPYISNIYKKEINGIDITIKVKNTIISEEALCYYHSNIYELINIIGVEG
jgi:hypothetical protein